ncbi:uncharacterized protein [Coffea arabica]|uniref:RNase H type-1 domain-containing protein n=1 Tax=Coffea arabica TaxID=13443 RepID=A0ABM4VUD7_COFAR
MQDRGQNLDQPKAKTEQIALAWILYVDGTSGRKGCRARLFLISPTREKLAYALRFDFKASNNEFEYETLIIGMEIASKMGAESSKAYSNSQLVVNQVLEKNEVKKEPLRRHANGARELKSLFDQFSIEQISRRQNKRADTLSKLPSISFGSLSKEVLVELVKKRAYEQMESAVIEVMNSWIDKYLSQKELFLDGREVRKLLLKSQRYVLVNGMLYRKSYLSLWLKCITSEEEKYILRELHEGICGNHVGPRVLAKKGMMMNYY